ncbi:MAG: transposase [Pontiella sp.]
MNPLYRQSQINKTRYGVDISRQTMADWMFRLAQILAMIDEAMRKEIRGLYRIEAELRNHPKTRPPYHSSAKEPTHSSPHRVSTPIRTSRTPTQKPNPKSHRLHPETLGQATHLHRTRPGRERHSPHGHRQKELALFRQCRSLPHMTNHTAKDYTPSQWKAARENI